MNKPASREGAVRRLRFVRAIAPRPTQQYDTGECLDRSGAATTNRAPKRAELFNPHKAIVLPNLLPGSFKSRYRHCSGAYDHAATRKPSAGSLPINTNDFTFLWAPLQLGSTSMVCAPLTARTRITSGRRVTHSLIRPAHRSAPPATTLKYIDNEGHLRQKHSEIHYRPVSSVRVSLENRAVSSARVRRERYRRQTRQETLARAREPDLPS
jgi:hypothetical protein